MHQLLIPIVERMHKPAGVQNLPGRRNVRVAETVFPQAAPDPPRQTNVVAEGRSHSFPARQQVYTAMNAGWLPATWEEDRFSGHVQSRLLSPNVGAWRFWGTMESVGVRPNIEKPPHIAYGSLFSLPGTPGA